MRIKKINIKDIEFEYCKYEESLKDSIVRIGLSFSIKVKTKDNKYECVDGHKRLSVISDILKDDPNNKLQDINVVVVDDGSTRTNDAWASRNTH